MSKLEIIISEQLIDKPGAPPAGFYFKVRRIHSAGDRALLRQMTEAVGVVVKKALESTISQITGNAASIEFEDVDESGPPKIH